MPRYDEHTHQWFDDDLEAPAPADAAPADPAPLPPPTKKQKPAKE